MHLGDFAHARLILIWGSNSVASNLHFWRLAQEAKRNGATLVCIDPRRTETAEKCHQHLALRPGTDGALALALMHQIFANGSAATAYLEAHVSGWEKPRERALPLTPERAGAAAAVSASRGAAGAAAAASAPLVHRGGAPHADHLLPGSSRRPSGQVAVCLARAAQPAQVHTPVADCGGPHAP